LQVPPAAAAKLARRRLAAGTPVRPPGLSRGVEGGGGGGGGQRALPARRGGSGSGGEGGGVRLLLRLLRWCAAGLLLSLAVFGAALAAERGLGWDGCSKGACEWSQLGVDMESNKVLTWFRYLFMWPAMLLLQLLKVCGVAGADQFSGLMEGTFFLGWTAATVLME
jgi:hypothetical protein